MTLYVSGIKNIGCRTCVICSSPFGPLASRDAVFVTQMYKKNITWLKWSEKTITRDAVRQPVFSSAFFYMGMTTYWKWNFIGLHILGQKQIAKHLNLDLCSYSLSTSTYKTSVECSNKIHDKHDWIGSRRSPNRFVINSISAFDRSFVGWDRWWIPAIMFFLFILFLKPKDTGGFL